MGLLRFLLAITVVIAHSTPILGFSLIGGKIAVQAFYIISGFYMTLILKEKYIGINGSYRLFISNRFLRIYPIYWATLILTVFYSVFVALYSHGINYARFTSYVVNFDSMNFGTLLILGFSNIFLFLQDWSLLFGLNTLTGNVFFTPHLTSNMPMLNDFLFIPQAWTIGIELTFYLVAPFLVKRKLSIICLFITLSFILRIFLMHFGLKDGPWANRFFPNELAFFLMGTISYHIYIKLLSIQVKKLNTHIAFTFILLLTLFYNFFDFSGKDYLYLSMFFICLPFVFILTKNWKFDSYIGELSYPIYISHMLMISFMSAFKIPKVGGFGFSLAILTIIFSVILNELIAKKVEKIRQQRITPILFSPNSW